MFPEAQKYVCGKTPPIADNVGNTALQLAENFNRAQIVEFLNEVKDFTALQIACLEGNVEAVRYLVSRGYTTNDKANHTASCLALLSQWMGTDESKRDTFKDIKALLDQSTKWSPKRHILYRNDPFGEGVTKHAVVWPVLLCFQRLRRSKVY